MAAILMLLMVVVVLLVEFLIHRSRKAAVVLERDKPIAVSRIEGIAMPQGLVYHPNHVWARAVDDQHARVGVDDMAQRLIGKVDRVVLPVTGVELAAGQSSTLLGSSKRLAAVVAPIEGEVLEVNPALRDNPQLVNQDPYGRGWLFQIRSWKLAEQLGNLLAGSSAKRWMEVSVQQLKSSLSGELGLVAQDGGELLEDIGSQLESRRWIKLMRQFLGTESMEYE